MSKKLKLNGTLVKSPDDYTIERYNLTKSGRVASGKMTMELVAKKTKILAKWKILDSSEVKQIMDIIDTNVMFFKVDFLEDGEWQTKTCYVGSIVKQLGRESHSNWYWKDVELHFIEQ